MAAAPAVTRPGDLPDGDGGLSGPWQLLTAPGARRFHLPASRSGLRRIGQLVQALPAGTTVVLTCAGLRSRGRCRRFARETGIELLREFVAVPSVNPPTCYVEDSRAALRYFFTELLAFPRGGGSRSAALTALKGAARAFFPASLLGLVAPGRVALGRIPLGRSGQGLARPMLDLPGMETVVVALSKDPNAKFTMLLIPTGSDQPSLAVKIPTTAAAEAAVAAERRVLLDLHSRLPSEVLASIPAVRVLRELHGLPWLVTTALPGTPMPTRYHSWRHLSRPTAVKADFQAVETWLAAFQEASAGPRAPVEMDGGLTGLLRRRFEADPLLEGRLARLDYIHSRLRTTNTPRTAVHGDFWFGNLLVTGERITGVIDWEGGAATGEPVRDLVRFALAYALYLDRHSQSGRIVPGHRGLRAGEWGAGIAWALEGIGWFPDLVRDFIRGGLTRLGADPGCWREALLAGLAEVAATADHLEFATKHWELFDRLA